MAILKPTADIALVLSGAVMTIPHLPVQTHVKTQCDAPSAQVTTHSANYRGYTVYKNLQQRKKTSLNNHKSHVNSSHKSNNV